MSMPVKKTTAKKTNRAKKPAVIKEEVVIEKINKENSPQKTFMASFMEKIKNPKIFIILIIIAAIGILYSAKGLFVAAVVNGKPISRIAIIQELEKRSGSQTLSSLIAKTLIFQEADKKNIKVSKQEIDESIKTIESSLAQQGQSLEDALALQGMTRNDFVEQIKIQKIIEKMFANDIKVTDKEIADYIEKNKESIPSTLAGKELNDTVKQQLEQQKLSTKFQDWLTNAQQQANIMYFVNY